MKLWRGTNQCLHMKYCDEFFSSSKYATELLQLKISFPNAERLALEVFVSFSFDRLKIMLTKKQFKYLYINICQAT